MMHHLRGPLGEEAPAAEENCDAQKLQRARTKKDDAEIAELEKAAAIRVHKTQRSSDIVRELYNAQQRGAGLHEYPNQEELSRATSITVAVGKLAIKEGDESDLGGAGGEVKRTVMYVHGSEVTGGLAVKAFSLTGTLDVPSAGFLCGVQSDTKGEHMAEVCLISLGDRASLEAAADYAEAQSKYEVQGMSDTICAQLGAGTRVRFQLLQYTDEWTDEGHGQLTEWMGDEFGAIGDEGSYKSRFCFICLAFFLLDPLGVFCSIDHLVAPARPNFVYFSQSPGGNKWRLPRA
jgi:hypothetical protein